MELDLEKFAYSFGLPGLLIVAWYLIEQAKGRRSEKAEEAKSKLEEKRMANEHELAGRKLDIEDKKASAMMLGFQSLTGMHATLEEHTRVDLEHHDRVLRGLRRIGTKLGVSPTTPAHGIPTRAGSRGEADGDE